MLRNAVGLSDFPEKKCYEGIYRSSTLVALRGGGLVSHFQEKRVT